VDKATAAGADIEKLGSRRVERLEQLQPPPIEGSQYRHRGAVKARCLRTIGAGFVEECGHLTERHRRPAHLAARQLEARRAKPWL
jgi:hypothetical protein